MIHYYAIGDTHGDFKSVRDFTQRNIQLHKDLSNGDENVLICLGDFGGNFFFNHRDEGFKGKLGKYPFTYFVIRGNHEERPSICMEKFPDKWHTEEYFGNTVYVENDYPFIKYALDIPAIYKIENKSVLVIPGAYSVDKFHRLANNWSWFEHEQLDNDEMDAGLKMLDSYNWECDLVLSHTCPIIYEPTDLFLSCVDQSAVDKTMERYLGQIEYKLDYKLWLWGHYHADRFYPETDEGRQSIMLFHKALQLDNWLATGAVNYGELI